LSGKLCYLLYGLSVVIAGAVGFEIANIRAKCTHEKAKITKVLKDIQRLKEEHNRLLVKYFFAVNPKTVDRETPELRELHENEVEYLINPSSGIKFFRKKQTEGGSLGKN